MLFRKNEQSKEEDVGWTGKQTDEQMDGRKNDSRMIDGGRMGGGKRKTRKNWEEGDNQMKRRRKRKRKYKSM